MQQETPKIHPFSELENYQGQCLPEQYIVSWASPQPQQLPSLFCPICHQAPLHPLQLPCPGKHIFGKQCLHLYSKKQPSILCPYCRFQVHGWLDQDGLDGELRKLRLTCWYCRQWEGNGVQFRGHVRECAGRLPVWKAELLMVVGKEKQELEREINPHLREHHGEIYQLYVQDWKWLESDRRDWKWWWWCDNPWWNKTPCQQCNRLWIKNENRVDEYQHQRVRLLSKIQEMEKTVSKQ